MPAPPPYGVSSTCPALSGVVARRSTASTAWPSSSALRTWRCSRNQPNQPGNSVNMSIFIGSLTEEVLVDVDLALLDRADRVRDERQQRAGLQPQHRAGGGVEHARPPPSARHGAPDQLRGEPLPLHELHVDQERLLARGGRGVPAAPPGHGAGARVAEAAEPDQWAVAGSGAALDRMGTIPEQDDRALRQRVRGPLHVEASVAAVRLADPPGAHEGQSTTSTSTRWPSRTAAAFMTVRRAATVRPPRPITLPASSSPTCSSSTIVPSSSSNPSTLTASGLSTSERARYSSSSSTRAPSARALRVPRPRPGRRRPRRRRPGPRARPWGRPARRRPPRPRRGPAHRHRRRRRRPLAPERARAQARATSTATRARRSPSHAP